MKTLKTKFFAFAFLALGFSALTTSCGKDDDSDYTSENINGEFIGTHKLQIPPVILNGLNEALPPDPETGEKPDLTAGFVDTLTLRMDGSDVIVYSNLLDISIKGSVVGANKFVIKETKYDTLNLGTTVQALGASVATSEPVTISSNNPNTEVRVKLILKAKSVAGFSLGNELTIPTNGTFVKQ